MTFDQIVVDCFFGVLIFGAFGFVLFMNISQKKWYREYQKGIEEYERKKGLR